MHRHFLLIHIESVIKYTVREKFVGVPDGGIALSPMGLDISYLQHSKSYDTCQHLLMRSEGFVLEGYDYFKKK